MYTKAEIDNLFEKRLSTKNIIERDGENVIIGKWSIIAPLGDNEFDVFICNPGDMRKGLSTNRVNRTVELLEGLTGASFIILDGEAYATLVGTDIIVENIKALGLRKRYTYTDEQKEALMLRLAKGRAAKSEDI